MSKSRNSLIFQPSGLFVKGSLNLSGKFRQAISNAIKKSQYSREQIVEMIEVLTEIRISKHILDQSTSSKQEYRFPAEVLHALCLITGSLEPLRVLAGSIGCDVIEPEETRELKILRLQREKERIEREIERLKKELKENEQV
ncbi:hypothetical protein [Thermodesulfovibrio yellowstonii]|uniref:hypothetical protein n=1 Tax=Thermodesulfovibrio yellowstonii TaxID=28262 RepID=UPI0024B31FDF|nr:hypothetical protein [Thermodesulfovibrio yellowstonii]MDI6865796.1 hypothetical protein [Thermodesulfovibrio yellowstonii]